MIERCRAERSTPGRRAGQSGGLGTPAPNLLAYPTLGVGSGQKVSRPLLASWGGACPRMAPCGRWDGAHHVVHSDNALRRHYTRRQQARIQPRAGRAVPLHPQPRLPLSGDDLRWDSHSSERFVGHPLLAVGAACDPARANRARGALSGTHLRRGVPSIQAQGAPLGVATCVSEKAHNRKLSFRERRLSATLTGATDDRDRALRAHRSAQGLLVEFTMKAKAPKEEDPGPAGVV